MEDVRMLNIYREIARVITSINLCLSEKEYENKMRASIDKMDGSYCEMELWLSSKTDYDILNISETETIKFFDRSARNYLDENRAAHSGIDIDKGYYNINDSFYMCLENWYTAYIKRLALAKVQEMQDLQEIVTLLEQAPTEPQPEQAPTEPQPEAKQKYYDKAIESGFIEKTDNGYKWVFGGKASLGYFFTKIYGISERIPYKNIEKLFNVTRLDRAVSQLNEAKKPQKWRIEIDKLIESLD